jgi:hypothetical protein
MLNRISHRVTSRGRRSRVPVRRAGRPSESDSAHWKQMVEAEARHRLKRALGARRK